MNQNRRGLLAMTKETMAGPLARNAACRSAGTSGPTTAARYSAARAGVSGTPAARITGLLGIQTPAPERAAEPPKVGAFSMTRVVRPRLAAVRAAVMPAAPEPTTRTSTVVRVGVVVAVAVVEVAAWAVGWVGGPAVVVVRSRWRRGGVGSEEVGAGWDGGVESAGMGNSRAIRGR